jgi:hypothetical protein
MHSERWKKVSLAINSIIRGLELDQVEFQYDEAACRELTDLDAGSAFAAVRTRGSSGSDVWSELQSM